MRAGRPILSGRRTESAGERLRAAILDVYELDAGEVVLLDQVASLCDALARVNDQVAGLEELTTVGSAGQTIEHPLLRAQRSYSVTLARLVEAMRLPAPGASPDEPGESAVTLAARRAANARWEKARAADG